jgi:hypothetical protein
VARRESVVPVPILRMDTILALARKASIAASLRAGAATGAGACAAGIAAQSTAAKAVRSARRPSVIILL